MSGTAQAVLIGAVSLFQGVLIVSSTVLVSTMKFEWENVPLTVRQ